jgi:hypothetical protein
MIGVAGYALQESVERRSFAKMSNLMARIEWTLHPMAAVPVPVAPKENAFLIHWDDKERHLGIVLFPWIAGQVDDVVGFVFAQERS